MGILKKIGCDGPGCPEVKRDGNYWLMGMMRIQPKGSVSVVLSALDAAKLGDSWITFCGIPCAQKKLGELLETILRQ